MATSLYGYAPAQDLPNPDVDSFDEFFGLETRIMQTKLEVLAGEIHDRVRIRSHNLERIDKDTEVARETLDRLDRLARYHLREHREKDFFYRQLFTLEAERRTQDVECWRDIVMVMRDFLYVWEAHERAQAKGRMLQNV